MNTFPSAEYKIIQNIKSVLRESGTNPRFEHLIGDDAAVRVNQENERLIMTADVSVENVHFSTSYMDLKEIAYRAMVTNLSDCAAMGATPDSALVQLVFPKNIQNLDDSIELIYTGFAQACKRWGFPIVGGDISCGPAWIIAIALTGRVAPEKRVVKRQTIRPGDSLWITGAAGKSAAGLAALGRWGRRDVPDLYATYVKAHISPVPRIEAGQALAADPQVHALMDLSDGLSKDVATLCHDNNIGFLFEKNVLPVYDTMIQLADQLGLDWNEWFYHGGEDYELIVAADTTFDPAQYRDHQVQFVRLGSFSDEFSGVMVAGPKDTMLPLKCRSYDHCSKDY